MNIMDTLKDLIADAIEEVTATEGSKHTRLSVWGSWSACDPARLAQLREAGCEEVILNVNDVTGSGKRWVWQNGREAVLERASRVIASGMSVAWMPWMWATPEWGQIAGQELAKLDDDLKARTGQGARLVQLDWEGHAETSAARLAKTRPMADVVDACLTALCRELAPEVVLGLTPLYFRRPAGDAALKWSREIGGRLWSIRELLPQAYSVWLPGNDRKARATHAPEYQPGILQRRAWENYAPFSPYLDEMGLGLNGWALDRRGADVPGPLRLSAQEAMDRAVEACLEVGAARVSFWALHLFDAPGGAEGERLGLVLDAMRRLSGGSRVDVAARTPDPDPEPTGGTVIHWEQRRVDAALAKGGAPKGYVLPQQRGVALASAVGPAGAILARARREGWPEGTVVPVTLVGRRGCGVVQRHKWTRRAGKRVPFNGPGCTMFVEA